MADPQRHLTREAEDAVIGGLLLAPERIADVASVVTAADFSNALHRHAFAAMAAMDAARQSIDLFTVAERLEAQGTLREEDLATLGCMVRDTPSAANVVAYGRAVRNYAKRRAIVALAVQAQRWALEEGDAEKTLTKLRDSLTALDSGQQDGPVLLRDLLTESVRVIDQRFVGSAAKGMATGLADLDALTLGLHPGKLYVVAGRPAMGKSVLGLQWAQQAVCEQHKTALFFTAEMPSLEQVERLLASMGRIALSAIQSGQFADEDWCRLTSALVQLSEAKLWLDETPAPQMSDILAKSRRLHRTQGPLGLVVIDHAGLVEGRGENREKQQADVGRACKALAKELGCPVVALVQLSRKCEERGDKRPILSDLRDTGEWEQSADVVAMIYRDEVYDPKSPDKGCAELLVRKHRGGALGIIPLAFQGAYARYDSLAGGLPSWNRAATPIRRERGLSL
ncbi:MAG: replicative DNA helicase [Candidatus Competibacter denitrificans]